MSTRAITWFLTGLVALGMAAVWDEPTETDAAAQTARVVADVTAEENAMRGPKP